MSDHRLVYGVYSIDVAARDVFRADQRLALPVKVFDCIVYLATNADRAVGRDELISAVWGKVDVSDNLLAQLILRARRVFEDGGDGQRFIRTIPGFGYRWVHPVGSIEPAVTEPAGATPTNGHTIAAQSFDADQTPAPLKRRASDLPSPPTQRRNVVAILAFAAVVLIVAVLTFVVRPHQRVVSDVAAAGRLTIVLPTVLHGEEDYAWARLGIMDLLAQRLRDAGIATVPSETIVALSKFAGTTPTDAELDELSAATGAQRMIASDITRAQNVWTVSLRTLRGDKATQTTSGESADLLAAADAAAGQLISRLDLHSSNTDSAGTPLDTRVQEIESAILSDQVDEARRLIQSAPAEMQRDPRIRLQLASMELASGHRDDARTALETLSREDAVQHDPLLSARALTLLAGAELVSNHYPASEKAADQAVMLLQKANLPNSGSPLGRALVARATSRSAQGLTEKAMDDFAAARIALAPTGNVRMQAVADVNYSVLQMNGGHFTEATAPLARSADLFRRLRLPSNELTARMDLVETHVALQNLDGAAAEEPRVTELIARTADPNVRLLAQIRMTGLAYQRGQFGDGEALMRTINADIPEKTPARQGFIEFLAARFALARGDAAEARRAAQHSLELPWENDEPRDYAQTWWLLARADREVAPDHGAATAEHARAWASATKTPTAALYAALAEAEYHGGIASDRQTGAIYERALAAATQTDIPYDMVAVSTSYANWLLGQGDTSRAAGVLRRNEAWSAASFPVMLAYVRLYQQLGNQPLWEAALKQARAIAGEREIPDALTRFADASIDAKGGRASGLSP